MVLRDYMDHPFPARSVSGSGAASGLAPLQFIGHLSRPDFAKDWIVRSLYPLALRASSPVPRVL